MIHEYLGGCDDSVVSLVGGGRTIAFSDKWGRKGHSHHLSNSQSSECILCSSLSNSRCTHRKCTEGSESNIKDSYGDPRNMARVAFEYQQVHFIHKSLETSPMCNCTTRGEQCSESRTMSMRTKRSDPFGRCQSPVQQKEGKSWSVGDGPLVGPAGGGKV